MRILALSGSLRRDAYNTALLRAAAEVAPEGVEVELYDPGALAPIPAYNEEAEASPPGAVTALHEAIAAADGVLIATPEYNGSLPGALKNALDWVSRPLRANPLRNKPVAVIGASPSMFGAVWAQNDARRVLKIIGARVLEDELPVGQAAAKFVDGQLVEPETRELLADVVMGLSDSVRSREAARAAAA